MHRGALFLIGSRQIQLQQPLLRHAGADFLVVLRMQIAKKRRKAGRLPRRRLLPSEIGGAKLSSPGFVGPNIAELDEGFPIKALVDVVGERRVVPIALEANVSSRPFAEPQSHALEVRIKISQGKDKSSVWVCLS